MRGNNLEIFPIFLHSNLPSFIFQDCRYHLYDSFYVNFSSAIPRPLLEEFASSTVQSESSQLVSKVIILDLRETVFTYHFSFLNFICYVRCLTST